MVTSILKGLFAVATKLVMTVASEQVIEWILFYVVEKIVETTKTQHDDEFYHKIKKAYSEGK